MAELGIGMTSQRTRERLIQRLMEQGITHFEVLEAIRSMPRHLFVDEALAHRSYEDTALPIGVCPTPVAHYVRIPAAPLLPCQTWPDSDS